ncbi:hypothetical protein NDU88_004578 [Pleurodeles waltl]|uniref:Uncharacterized protein n=1 Tax=Pleurodeles waltl TaxID=8319 RepID=A0AAV7QFA0_PLEWA|nr:hypothetical protein NDU88_004578 [Pleurodeles waltl]
MTAGNREQLKAQSTVRVHWIATQQRGLTKERYKGAPLQPLTLASEGAARGLMHHILERRKAFLALRPSLRQLEVKFGLFEPARMWITKNNVSKDFYDPIDLRLYLDSLSVRPMDMAILPQPRNLAAAISNPLPPESAPE